jgi:hypothetical protein
MGSISGSKRGVIDGPKPGQQNAYPIPEVFIDWLESGMGRAQYFGKVDPLLPPPLISKIKAGRVPITFEYACRLERAQKPSKAPFKAGDIMTFEQDRDLYRYVAGLDPAPPPVVAAPKPMGRPRKDGGQVAGA